MVKVITVEREFAAEGVEYARLLAERLGWRLVDQSLVEKVAEAAGVKPEVVTSCDERLDPWYHRMGKVFWRGGVEHVSGVDIDSCDSDGLLVYLQQVIRSEAASGNCVIVGRAASSILNGVAGCFHVFIYASMPHKKRFFEGQFPEKAKHAEQEIRAQDAARAAYVRKHYHHDWDNRHLYHLMLNSCMGQEAMVGATVDAIGKHE